MGDDTLARIIERLDAAPAGLHRLNEPLFDVPGHLPEHLAVVYNYLDGGELFHGAVELFCAADVTEADGRFHFGRVESDELYTDAAGKVWRLDADSDELVEEGSRLHRWLLGFIEGEATMFDDDGEFAEDVYAEDGALLPEFIVRRERRLLKRDRDAIGPRWRLARALSQQDRLDEARDQLEQVVAKRAGFPWAWYDLARISEALGELETAVDEMAEAAEADPDCAYRSFFWAQCARLSQLRDDEPARRQYADRALKLDPHLARAHLDGACERLDAGDPAGAKTLVDLALAIAPLDLAALDLRVQVETALEEQN